MFLLIDNYDSFTYNLAQDFQLLGHKPTVLYNDDPEILRLAAGGQLSRVCISSGPGSPPEAGLALEFLKILDVAQPQVPVLGVGLGHQLLAAQAGGEIYVAPRIMHGKSSQIHHDGQGIFAGLPNPFEAGRYHSLLVSGPPEGGRFAVTARTGENEIMGLKYLDRPWFGLQFHPESILSPQGPDILAHFVGLGREGTGPDQALEPPVFEEPPIRLSVMMESIAAGQDLDQERAAQLFGRLMDGELNPSQAGALLMGLRAKGETALEMAEAALAVLNRAVPLPPLPGPVLDIVGTGGDGRNSFNCSTATALTVAGLGYKVVKHGNRSISSKSGSADALELLGVDLNSPPESVPRSLEATNFAFLFAPNYHPAFRHIMPVRKELGIRTLFNILGPLVNPARPEFSFLGVPNLETLPLLAGALARLNTKFSAIVHGAGGYDEMTTLGPNAVYLVEGEKISQMTIDPAEYGFKPCRQEELAISGPAEGVAVLKELLAGGGPEPMREMLILNVAMALYVRRGAESFDRSLAEAREAVAAGAGRKALGQGG